jgi:DNA-binding LytR/AlgR family response regulator
MLDMQVIGHMCILSPFWMYDMTHDIKSNCQRSIPMIKIIWKKDDFTELSDELTKIHNIHIISDPTQISEQHIGIMIEDRDYDKVKPILESIIKTKYLMFFETKEGWMQVDIREVTHIESFGDDIYMHTKEQVTHIIKTPLYQLEEKFDGFDIIRISKSYMVNVIHIRYIKTTLYGKLDLELSTGKHLEVTRSFVKTFKRSIGLSKREDSK